MESLRNCNDSLGLIITGCIAPVSQKYLVLTNTEERLRQYINSIKYYLEKSCFKKIIFCDNSNYDYKYKDDIYNIATKMGKKFEWLSFLGNTQKIVNQGKGYGEGEIIKYVLKNSTILKSCSFFAKVTGRLIITNINEILQKVNFNKYKIFMNADIYRKRGIDTRFYIIRKDIYILNYMNIYKKVNDNIESPIALEDIFYLKTQKCKTGWHNIFPFPRFLGISGGNGRNYAKESEIKLKVFDFLCKKNHFKKVSLIYYFSLSLLQKIR